MNPLRDELLGLMESLTVVDCHSHTRLKAEYNHGGPWSLFQIGKRSSWLKTSIA